MNSQRYHSLDAMRGILMLLGVYFHLAMNYVGDPPDGHPLFGLFMVICHYFRMHAFFLISGFFGALLVYRKGAKEMLQNRVKRVLYPLLVLSVPIWYFLVFVGYSSGSFFI